MLQTSAVVVVVVALPLLLQRLEPAADVVAVAATCVWFTAAATVMGILVLVRSLPKPKVMKEEEDEPGQADRG